MNENADAKNCAACGADLRQKPHLTNEQGKGICVSCTQLQQDVEVPCDGSGRQSFRTCTCCGVEVLRKECHRNRYGEYVCRACQRLGRRMSHRRELQNVLFAVGKWLIYLAGAMAVLAVAYKTFAVIARNVLGL
jgi:hypothetical protein